LREIYLPAFETCVKDAGEHNKDLERGHAPARLPRMISSFGLFFTVVPLVATAISYCLCRYCYPITPEVQKQMAEALAAKNTIDGSADIRPVELNG
jgi:hypothetical protein